MKKVGVVVENPSMSNSSINYSTCFFCHTENSLKVNFCQNCNKILPFSSNFFDIFNLVHEYKLDKKNLNNRYLDLQTTTHPDLFVKKTDIEQSIAAKNTIILNDAFQTLIDDYKRSCYLLKLKNINIYVNMNQYFDNAIEFLDEIMNLNEELLELDYKNKHDFQNKIDSKINNVTDALNKEFLDKSYKKAANLTIRLKYYSKILEELELID